MSINGSTTIQHCPCINTYQDKRYGKGKRVHNVCGQRAESARCTSCAQVKIKKGA